MNEPRANRPLRRDRCLMTAINRQSEKQLALDRSFEFAHLRLGLIWMTPMKQGYGLRSGCLWR